ncbi:hypothetical protein D9Q98_004676 [Chlorella vulgaris]|uniref:Uncharacterized protein n=1 Tax=Chlorella vulgaris TaxID=3077 RepID=A0A9D4YXN5_CHLVU|nr:hypothetical protein D9Q98_004676 [Chlorella vulgaris]
MPTALHILLPILIGIVWGSTNPFIARGARIAAARTIRRITGVAAVDSLLHHLLTPDFILPQALNLSGSVLFAATLGGSNVSFVVPVANGVSLAANAVFDYLLGDSLSSPISGISGLLLVFFGVTLCSLAQQGSGQEA